MRHLERAILLAAVLLTAGCDRPAPAAVDASRATSPEEMPVAPRFDAAALGIASDADTIADGREIAVTHCSSCHGLDREASPRAGAPPLRHVLSLHAPESLSEDFRAGIHVGHADMPDFVFGDLGMDVLLAYLVSIQEAPPPE